MMSAYEQYREQFARKFCEGFDVPVSVAFPSKNKKESPVSMVHKAWYRGLWELHLFIDPACWLVGVDVDYSPGNKFSLRVFPLPCLAVHVDWLSWHARVKEASA